MVRGGEQGRLKEEVAIECAHGWQQYARESVELVNAVTSADSQQMTWSSFYICVRECLVSGVPSHPIPHTHSLLFSPLPTWQAWKIPLTSLFTFCPHTTAWDFLGLCFLAQVCTSRQPTAAPVTCVRQDVIPSLSFLKSSLKHFCYEAHTLRASLWPR